MQQVRHPTHNKGKCKFLLRTDHKGPEGEQMYSSTLPSTSALDGTGGQHHAPAALPPGKTRCSLYRRLGGPQGPVWTSAENLAPTRIRSQDRPARSESLYRLSYPGPIYTITLCNFRIISRICGGGELNWCLSPAHLCCKYNFIVFSCCWGNTSPPKQMPSLNVLVISRW